MVWLTRHLNLGEIDRLDSLKSSQNEEDDRAGFTEAAGSIRGIGAGIEGA